MTRWDQAMQLALDAARAAGEHEDVPVGAVVLDSAGKIVAIAGNERELTKDPTAHAELVALRKAAAALGQWQLSGCTMVVTLEPCPMCAGAIVAARMKRLVFGAFDPKGGGVTSLFDLLRDPRLNHRVEVVSGVLVKETAELLRSFFRV